MRYASLVGLCVLVLTACNAPSASAQAAKSSPGETRTVMLAVSNMTCPTCPYIVRSALKAVPGVIDARVDYARETATVVFDPSKTDVAALTKATTDVGFPSTLKK